MKLDLDVSYFYGVYNNVILLPSILMKFSSFKFFILNVFNNRLLQVLPLVHRKFPFFRFETRFWWITLVEFCSKRSGRPFPICRQCVFMRALIQEVRALVCFLLALCVIVVCFCLQSESRSTCKLCACEGSDYG